MKLHIYRNGKTETIEVDGWVCDESGEWSADCDNRKLVTALALQTDNVHVKNDLLERLEEL